MFKNVFSTVLIAALLMGIAGCKQPDSGQTTNNTIIAGDSMPAENSLIATTDPSDAETLPTVEVPTANESEKRLASTLQNNAVIFADRSVKKLTFHESEQVENHSRVDIYLDEEQNKLRFNEAGKLTGYTAAKSSSVLESKTRITQEQANKIALQHILDTYGNILEGYVLDYCNDDDPDYDFMYVKKYGTDGFVKGESCLISVYHNGTVRHSSIVHVGKYADFDTRLLNGLSAETIQSYVLEKTDDSVQATINDIRLKKQDNKYVLLIQTTIENGDYAQLQEYIYPLQ